MDAIRQSLLAEIIVNGAGASPTRGSGYLIAPGWILTANHVVTGASDIGVWLGAPTELRWNARMAVDPARLLSVRPADLALLPVDSSHRPPAEPALLGRLNRESTSPVRAIAAGFPRFKLRLVPGREDVTLRERHDAIGSIAPGSNAKTNTYELSDLNLRPDDDPEPRRHSPWEGMSGAAVWANGRLIGVVAQHHPQEGTGALTVRPIEALFAHGTAEELADWRTALGPRLPGRAWDLWLANDGLRHRAIQRAFDAARELAPTVLESRDSELAELDAFANSDGQWWWLHAPAFAGKTALAAWFACHPPAGVDIVSCFLRRTTGENTAAFALDTLNAQLAAWSDRSGYVAPAYPSEKKQDFPGLFADAARASAERGRRLLMLIDGADEYDASPTGLRLGDWLPGGSLPLQAALLMTSRSGSTIELPVEHPLQNHVHVIAASAAAGQIENIARRDLDQALSDTGGIQYPLLGFLAAATGGLTNRDLAALLTRNGHHVYTATVDTAIGRSLDRILVQSASDEGSKERLNGFAHETLLSSAREKFADDLSLFEGQIFAWCQHYKDHGWPKDTPAYALLQYPRYLRRAERDVELFGLLVDEQWSDRHMQIDPTGHSYLEGIEIIWTTAEALNEKRVQVGALAEWLGVETHCALTSASVRNLSSGVELSLLLALTGSRFWSERQAWRIASLNPSPLDRGENLARLAPRLKEPIRTAAIRDGYLSISGITDEFPRVWLLEKLAPHLPESLIGDALHLARSFPVRLADGRNPRLAALDCVLPRAAALGRAREALSEAVALKDERERARVLAHLAPTLSVELKREALRTIKEMKYIDARAEGLTGFAKDAGDADAALLNEALDAALSSKYPATVGWTLYALAPLVPKDRLEEVLAAAKELERGKRFRVLAEIAARFGRVGDRSKALSVARGLKSEDDIWFVRALVGVARSIPDSERDDLAREMLTAAEGLAEPIFLPRELAEVAPFLSEPLLRDAIQFAQDIEDPDRGAETLAVLLPQLAKLNHHQEAFDLALTTAGAKSGGKRMVSRTLSTLIPLFPKPLQTRACQEALADANRIDDWADRLSSLGRLASFLSDDKFRYVLESIPKIDGAVQSQVLEHLAHELPDHLLEEALVVARSVPVLERGFGLVLSSPRADALIALADRLPEPAKNDSLQQAANAIEQIESATERARASARLARLVTQPLQLPKTVRQEAIEAACAVGAGNGRLAAVAELGPYAPASIVGQVAAEIHASDERRSNQVRMIIDHIRSDKLADSEVPVVLRDALSYAAGIEGPEQRATSMSLLVPYFSALLERDTSEIKDERAWKRHQSRVLKEVGPLLEPNQLPEAIGVALSLRNDTIAWSSFASLAPSIAKLSPVDAYASWRTLLRPLSTGRRADLLRHLGDLLPIIVSLGGSASASKMAEAIKLTGEWWR